MAYQQPFLNADGFGVGWYTPPKDGEGDAAAVDHPCVFTSLKPAWNDPNLRNISEEVRSPLVLAHIRAAGPALPVSEGSCHPFKAGRLLFAHNGMVGDFSRVRRELLHGLSEFAFSIAVEHGCIDSAVAFGVLLTELGIEDEAGAMREYTADDLCGALHRTIERLVAVVGGQDESLLNFVLCDGQRIVACRFATAPSIGGMDDNAEEPQPLGATLYLSAGSRWVAEPDDPQTYRMRKGADIKCCTAILSSEPLTPIREEWLPIAPNSLVLCGIRRGHIHNIDILMFPLRDGPPRPLSALLGVEKSAAAAAEPSEPAGAAVAAAAAAAAPAVTAPALLDGEGGEEHADVWMSLTGHTEDVNCLASLFQGRVVAAGSMDGTLRLFNVETGQNMCVRRHSGNGPILALLGLQGPSSRASSDESPPSSATNSPRSPNNQSVGSGQVNGRGLAVETNFRGTNFRGRSPSLVLSDHEDDNQNGRGILDISAPLDLLLSTSNDELRVWDIRACAATSGQNSREEVSVPCLFCFRFAPNQGQLLTLAGTLESMFLGFQSTRLFRLQLKQGWDKLMTYKNRSRSTRYFTFNVDYNTKSLNENSSAQDASACGGGGGGGGGAERGGGRANGVAPKFCYHTLLEPLHGSGGGHLGFVHCLAHDPRSGTLASGGGDGQVIFWGRQQQRAAFPHGGAVLALALGRNGEMFSGDANGRIRVWDCSTVERGSRAVLTVAGKGPAILVLVTVEAPCGEGLLLAGNAKGLVRIWHPRTSTVLREVDSSMSCCAALCLLEMDLSTHRTDPKDRWLVRIACGGCRTGAVHIGDVGVVVMSNRCRGAGAAPQQSAVGECLKKLKQEVSSRSQADSNDFRRLLTLLSEFVGIRTVSSDPQCGNHIQRGSVWVAQQFEKLLGCTVRVSGSCVVGRCGWDEGKPLVVLYSHFDVVNAEGVEWDSDPWQLTARDGFLYGRGVVDNKGPLLAQIFAVRRLLRTGSVHRWSADEEEDCGDFVMRVEEFSEETSPGRRGCGNLDCPVNVLFVADGSAEVGNIRAVRQALQEAREDGWIRGGGVAGILVNNSSWINDESPCICYGMRGVIDLEIRVTGGERPLHSGMHGGLIPEPTFDLMALCASLADASGMSCVPNFTGGVRPPREEDLQNLETAARALPTSELRQRLGRAVGAPAPSWLAEEGSSGAREALRRTWLSPALSITEVGKGPLHDHGRHIAHQAACVVSTRTVPEQRQEDVVDALHRHLRHEFEKRRSPNRLEITTLSSCDWWEARTSSPIYIAARQALAEAWGISEAEVFAVREGGTMSMLPALEAELGCDSVQMALSQASSAIHLANERIATQVLARAVDAIAGTLVRVGAAFAEANCRPGPR